MGLLQDGNFELTPHDSPLSKRRRFMPLGDLPIIPVSDNTSIEHHTFDSPLILQLCEQFPSPEQIESELFNVGMRVRKAVPEGYKTHRFTPRPFFNMNRLSPETQAAISGNNSPTQGNAELFSAGGLHNVGGLAMQPLSTATFCGISLSTLAKYESSYNDQKMWSYSTSHKRNFLLEEEEGDSDGQDWSPQTPTLMGDAAFGMPVDYFNIDTENVIDAPMHFGFHQRQSSTPFEQTSVPELNAIAGRRVAKPRSRVRTTMAATQDMSAAPVQFNPFAGLGMIPEQVALPPSPILTPAPGKSCHTRMLSCGMEMNNWSFMNEFADVGFLQRREDVEMDCS